MRLGREHKGALAPINLSKLDFKYNDNVTECVAGPHYKSIQTGF